MLPEQPHRLQPRLRLLSPDGDGADELPAADESCRSLERARRIAETGAADCLNLKLAKSGLLESIRIADYAKKMKLKLMIGCMMESPVGLSVPVHWACGSGDFSFVDLDSFLLLRPTPFQSGFSNRGSRLSVGKGLAGTGVKIPS
jgi:L-alanine-DL-glutamate epimerase-like enolase superfamily enzyme